MPASPKETQGHANQTAEISQHSLNQLTEIFGLSGERAQEAAQRSARNFQVLADCGSVLANGFGDLSREWLSLSQEQTRRNLDGLNNLLRSRSPQDLVAAQSDLVRQSLESFFNSSIRLAELSSQIAGEAMQKITAEGDEAAQQPRRSA